MSNPCSLADLHNVREFLMQALGPDFTRSALTNQDNHVSARVSVLLLHALLAKA